MFYPSSDRLEHEQTVDIVLDHDVLSALYRRGRRRFRDIQASSRAALKLDRLRGVLRATGTKDAIADVQRQLECVSGSHYDVAAAVWAELMRTRTEPDLNQAAVARIQHESGCRIHIERSAQQVQLFGPKDNSVVAQWLLEKLESLCMEEVLDVKSPLNLDLQKLQTFAQNYGVTVQVDERSLTILGIAGAVIEAARELRKYASNNQTLDLSIGIDCGEPSEVAREAITTAMSKLKMDSEKTAKFATSSLPTPSTTYSNGSSMSSEENSMQGAVTLRMPEGPSRHQAPKMQETDLQWAQEADSKWGFDACPTCGGGRNFCVQCGNPTGKMLQCPLAACPTCGVVNFCAYCGHATGKKKEFSGNMQQAVSKSVPYGYEPGMFCADQVPMRSMQIFQPGVNGTGNQVLIPVTMYNPYNTQYQQGVPVLANVSSNGLQAASPNGQFSQAGAGFSL
mmetsp:Transcript_17739/g.32828  ORF Transcript_17739/g.32828 Transcript_17739/m.32828 type:complete len:452 (+) Transcript_17739:110-1465(+)